MESLPYIKTQQLSAITKNLRDLIDDPNSLLNTPQQQFPNNAETFSYSGSDVMCLMFIPDQQNGNIKASGFIEIEDSLQTLTVSSARSVSPVRRLGETNPVAYTRGSRTIAGSMVFTVGLRDAFIKALTKSLGDGEPLREPTLFVDQIPKFSVFLQATNELGGVSTAVLTNITLTNFGTTFSIDDIYTESTFTYVAEQYFPLSMTKNTSNIGEIAKAIREITKIFNVKEVSIDSLMDQIYGAGLKYNNDYTSKWKSGVQSHNARGSAARIATAVFNAYTKGNVYWERDNLPYQTPWARKNYSLGPPIKGVIRKAGNLAVDDEWLEALIESIWADMPNPYGH